MEFAVLKNESRSSKTIKSQMIKITSENKK